MQNWFIKRQYILQDRIITEYWNRHRQAWLLEEEGEGYTKRGANSIHQKLFRKSLDLTNLSVTSYKS